MRGQIGLTHSSAARAAEESSKEMLTDLDVEALCKQLQSTDYYLVDTTREAIAVALRQLVKERRALCDGNARKEVMALEELNHFIDLQNSYRKDH